MSASISLRIASQAEPILCTGNHPFWSENRQDFIRADSLQPHETLRTSTGTTTVTGLIHTQGVTPVFNLEIHGLHVYHVGTAGVLVHNGVGDDCLDAEEFFNPEFRTKTNAPAEAFPKDFSTKNTKNWSGAFKYEGEARALARTKLGKNPVEIEPGKWRSADGKWQYRGKPGDLAENHIHLEELDQVTGEVLQNLHLRWPDGAGR